MLTLGGAEAVAETDPRGVAVSPDGTFLYVTTGGGPSITWWAINQASGEPTYQGMLTEAQSGGEIEDPTGIVISNDGTNVYIGSYEDRKFTSYTRNPTSGALTYLGTTIAQRHYDSYSPLGMAISPDDKQ